MNTHKSLLQDLVRLSGINENAKQQAVSETTDVTDYGDSPQRNAGKKTRTELLATLKQTKDSGDAERARKAGATQQELKQALKVDESTNDAIKPREFAQMATNVRAWLSTDGADTADLSDRDIQLFGTALTQRLEQDAEFSSLYHKSPEAAVKELLGEGAESLVPSEISSKDIELVTTTKQDTDDQQEDKIVVPAKVLADLAAKIKEIKFKVEHLAHIDPSYQPFGYWAQFGTQLEQIQDTLKTGTSADVKLLITKLQGLETISAVEVPDSLWKFLSVDMHKSPADKQSLTAKFQAVRQSAK